MTECLYTCVGYCCDLQPVILYREVDATKKTLLINDWKAEYLDRASSLDELDARYEIYQVMAFDSQTLFACHGGTTKCCPTIYFVQLDDESRVSLRHVLRAIENDTY